MSEDESPGADEATLRRRDGTVCVGVDGSQASRRAVLWGAVEARLRRAPLLLVHVELVPTESLGANVREISGELMLALSAKAAVELEPDIDVRTELVTGSSVRTELVQLTQRCTVLAMGIDLTRSRATHGARGPIEDYVAVHADCPVVMVAPASFVAPGARTQVTVGWSEGYNARLALAAAAEEAHLRGAVLSVVSVPPVIDPRLVGIVPTPDHESALIDAVSDLEHRYPGLQIDIAHRTGDVRAALSAMSALSELFVLGSHHSSKPWSIRTGPVAEALMRDGHCPVMLVGRRAKQRGGQPAAKPVTGAEGPSPSQVWR
jgi:nucleotide-binding universal stress UspA family protein